MSRNLNRVEPVAPVGAYKTYAAVSPLTTHWRQATCAEVECKAHANGWKTIVDVNTPLGRNQHDYIKHHSERRFTIARAGTLVTFTFEAGQECFDGGRHRVPLEREPIFLVRGGDWRGNPSGARRQHANADDWVDDFATHQDKIANR